MSKTVNFIEAVNSGERFKIKGNLTDKWFKVSPCGTLIYDDTTFFSDKNDSIPSDKGLFNAYFELEEKSIALTEAHFNEVMTEAMSGTNFQNIGYSSVRRVFISNISKELGF